MGNWVLGVLMSGGGDRLEAQCVCVGVCRCEWTDKNSAAAGLFSTTQTLCISGDRRPRRGQHDEDKCENARRNPGRESQLIKNSAREKSHYRAFRLVAALRINYHTNGLQHLWMGWDEAGFSRRKGKEKKKKAQSSVSKRPSTQGRGGEGGKENALPAACCCYLQIQTFIAELEKCIFHMKGSW